MVNGCKSSVCKSIQKHRRDLRRTASYRALEKQEELAHEQIQREYMLQHDPIELNKLEDESLSDLESGPPFWEEKCELKQLTKTLLQYERKRMLWEDVQFIFSGICNSCLKPMDDSLLSGRCICS